MDKDTNKNLFLAIAMSLLVLLGWQFYFAPEPAPPSEQPGETANGSATSIGSSAVEVPVPGTGPAPIESTETGPEHQRAALTVKGSRITGSIDLAGGRFDDVVLSDYRETIEPDSPNIHLFAPRSTAKPYFAEFYWLDEAGTALARGDMVWQTDARELAPGHPAKLTWTAPSNVVFTRTIEVDEYYMFTITDRVRNDSGDEIVLRPIGRIFRTGKSDDRGTMIRHVGAVGVLDDTLEEVSYDDLEDDGEVSFTGTQGWLGITDIFWLTALAPADGIGSFDAAYQYDDSNGARYQVDYQGEARALAPNGTTEATVRLFVGAKEIDILNHYRDTAGIPRFDMAIDFGWFFFLTKPLLSVLIYFANIIGNFGLAILLVTVIIKIIFFPLANKSYKSMSKMKALQPKIVELRENYGDDKARLQQEMMALYKREKANPVSGCLPIVLQIPVFFALYKVLFVSIEMRHAPFYGWINDLSARDPTTIFNLFGLVPWDPPSFLMIGIWPLIMGVTMFAQQKLNPAPPDPMQAKVFMLMPIMFTVILAGFPAGLVIYWSWNNLLSMGQQYVIMRRMGVAIGGGTTK